jgi:hypothetical protein
MTVLGLVEKNIYMVIIGQEWYDMVMTDPR